MVLKDWAKIESTIGNNQPAWRKQNKYIEVDYNCYAPKEESYWQTFLVDNGTVINLTKGKFKTKSEALIIAKEYMENN